MAHHGLGEEVWLPALGYGAPVASLVVVGVRFKLRGLWRWMRRR